MTNSPLNNKLFEDYFNLVLDPLSDGSYENSLKSFNLVLDSAMYLIKVVHEGITQKDRTIIVNDALILFQKAIIKGIPVRTIAEGKLSYKNEINNDNIKALYEPMSMSTLIRSQYESFCTFHNIYLSNNSEEIRAFLYYAWVLSGLNTRQRFIHDKMPADLKLKAQKEKNLILEITNRIKENIYYKSLGEKKRKWVDDEIKKRAFGFLIKDDVIQKPGWSALFLNSGVIEMYKNQYSALSLNTHPSNVSVFQFASMFDEGENINMSKSLLNRSKEIMAFLIQDYCTFIPDGKTYFNQLPEINKVLIDFINMNYRNGQITLYDNRNDFQKKCAKFLGEKLNSQL